MRHCAAWRGTPLVGELRIVTAAVECYGEAQQGEAMSGQVRQGEDGHGEGSLRAWWRLLRISRRGDVWPGAVGLGSVRRCEVRLGRVGFGKARIFIFKKDRQ